MKKIAVLVAGGIGSRMNHSTPKQFLLIHDKPLIYYTIQVFFESFSDLEMILVLPKDFIETGQQIVQDYFPQHKIQIVPGGATRFHSVQNGLQIIQDDSIVFIHDAVRCLISSDLIKKCYEEARIHGNAIPVIFSKDSIRLVDKMQNHVVDRTTVAMVQTPQVFMSTQILPAFNAPYHASFTDEASVAEAYGLSIHLVEGEDKNIKITTPFDLTVAKNMLQ